MVKYLNANQMAAKVSVRKENCGIYFDSLGKISW